MLIGILLTAAIAWALGLAHSRPAPTAWRDLSSTAFKLDVPAALNLKGGLGLSLVEIIFVFLFVDLFDNVGTLVAVTKRAGLVAQDGIDPAPESHPARRFRRDDGRRGGRHEPGDELHRERRRVSRWAGARA